MIVKCKECGKDYEIKWNEKISNFICDCGGELRTLTLSEINDNLKNLKGKKSEDKMMKYRAQMTKSEDKKKYIEDKKKKYGFLKVARGKNGRLELYDNSIRIYDYQNRFNESSGKDDYLIEDIVSIEFKEAELFHSGIIYFHIRGMYNKNKPGAMLFYGPKTGYTIGLGSTGSSKSPKTYIKFPPEWEAEFREIKDLIEAKMLEYKGMTSNETKIDLNDLEKLAEFRDKGIITEKEFQAKKKQILGL